MSLIHDLEVAYFSMEIMLESDIPTYAGGLGVLAGDLLRSCADMEIDAVGVTLVYNGNQFTQQINANGTQTFKETDWRKIDQLTKIADKITLTIADEEVTVGTWRYDMVGQSGHVVPIYLLDTDYFENGQWAREITANLYGGRDYARICQELVLGIGGVKMLRHLGYHSIKTFHMNEGHAAFVPLALLEENSYNDDAVKKHCVFTTHTPVPEGHDRFSYDFAFKYGKAYFPWHIKNLAGDNHLHMTKLGMSLSHYSFGVSKKHGEVSNRMFPGRDIHAITNGVHPHSWIGPIMQDLYNKYIPGWIEDPDIFTTAVDEVPDDALWQAHQESKRELISYVNKHLTSVLTEEERLNPHPDELFDLDTMTISLARRPVAYKRPLLLYQEIEKFIRIGVGKVQIIQCGKSHPADDVSQGFVREILRYSKKLKGILKIVYLENYSPRIARVLVSGSDVWLNTPRKPLEASGTSGMKAAMNGVINFSILDGWWIEANQMCPLGGFTIGSADEQNDDAKDAEDLYNKLQTQIIPMYYDHRTEWIKRMKYAITLGAYFNTHRCIREYRKFAWNT